MRDLARGLESLDRLNRLESLDQHGCCVRVSPRPFDLRHRNRYAAQGCKAACLPLAKAAFRMSQSRRVVLFLSTYLKNERRCTALEKDQYAS